MGDDRWVGDIIIESGGGVIICTWFVLFDAEKGEKGKTRREWIVIYINR